MAKHKTDEEQDAKSTEHKPNTRADGRTEPAKPSRGQNEGIGTENDPHGAAPDDPRKHRGQNEGLGTENKPSGTAPGTHVRSEPPQKPVSSGPTVADADAPVLEGHEAQKGPDGKEQTYETVRLTDGPGEGAPFRVATPLPLVVVSAGRRYVRSTPDTYVLQVP